MSIDLKAQAPDPTVPVDAVLFGADSQAVNKPSVFPVQNVLNRLYAAAETGSPVALRTPDGGSLAVGNGNIVGAVSGGVVDNYAVFASALAAGGLVTLPSGTFAVSSAALGLNGLTIAPGTEFVGDVHGGTTIVITGTSDCNLFRFDNTSNVTIRNLRIRGNNRAGDTATGSVIYARQTAGATSVMQRVIVDKCVFENFKGDYWLRFESLSTAYAMRHIRVTRCLFFSEPGNAREPSLIGVPSFCVQFYGPESGSVCIEDARVDNCTADIPHIKGFFVAWQGCRQVRAHDNLVRNCGTDASIPNDTGVYAFLIYRQVETGPKPDRIELHDNTVDGVKSCGVYVVGALRVSIDGLECYNQTDTVDSTLPKGAVALNGGAHVTIRNLRGVECIRGIQVVGETAGKYVLQNVEISSSAASAVGCRITSFDNQQAHSVEIDGLIVDVTGANAVGVDVLWGASFAADRFSLKNFRIAASLDCIRFRRFSGQTPASKHMHIANGVLSGASNIGLTFVQWAGANQRAVFENIQFAGGWGANAYQASFDGSTGFVARNFTFCDEPAGATGNAWDAPSAQGAIEGFRYINCPTASYRVRSTGLEDLGRETPTWTATQGVFVQNLLPNSTVPLGWSRDGAGAWVAV